MELLCVLLVFICWLLLFRNRVVSPVYGRTINRQQCKQHTLVLKNRPKPQWVVKEIIRLKAIMGQRAGCRTIAHTFNRLHGARKTVGKSFVAYTIRNHRYAILHKRRELKAKRPRWIPINHTWSMDLSFYCLDNQIVQPFVGILDHGSRKAMCLHTVINKSSWTLLGHLCLSIGRYGKPNKLRTDNEAVFNSFVFRYFLKLVGIQHQLIPTASPWCNGRVERFFGTLKPLLREYAIRDRNDLQHMLYRFRCWYNQHRPHQNLNSQTPEEIWRKQKGK